MLCKAKDENPCTVYLLQSCTLIIRTVLFSWVLKRDWLLSHAETLNASFTPQPRWPRNQAFSWLWRDGNRSWLFCFLSGLFHWGHELLVDCQDSLKPCSTFLYSLLDMSGFVVFSDLHFYVFLSGLFLWADMLCDTKSKGCRLTTSKNERSVDRAENCPCWSLKRCWEIR